MIVFVKTQYLFMNNGPGPFAFKTGPEHIHLLLMAFHHTDLYIEKERCRTIGSLRC